MTQPSNQLGLVLPELKRKGLSVEIKDADKGLVEAIFSTFDVKDHDNDVTVRGAFDDGAAVRISSFGHSSWMGELPVGKGVIAVVGDHAVLKGEFFLGTTHGRETFETIKQMGALQEWSYGYDVVETGEVTEGLREKGVTRVLKKLKVHEVSPVLVGAGIETQTLSTKGRPDEDLEDDMAIVQAAMTAAALKELARFERTRVRLILGL